MFTITKETRLLLPNTKYTVSYNMSAIMHVICIVLLCLVLTIANRTWLDMQGCEYLCNPLVNRGEYVFVINITIFTNTCTRNNTIFTEGNIPADKKIESFRHTFPSPADLALPHCRLGLVKTETWPMAGVASQCLSTKHPTEV